MKARDLDQWSNIKHICHRDDDGGAFVMDERHTRRMGIHDTLLYRRTLNGDEYRAKFYDISKTGMSMVSDYPYLPGTQLYFRAYGDNSRKIDKASVVWTKPYNPHQDSKIKKYRVGVKFVRI